MDRLAKASCFVIDILRDHAKELGLAKCSINNIAAALHVRAAPRDICEIYESESRFSSEMEALS